MDETFEKENTLNTTFEKNESIETLDESKEGSRFVEFMDDGKEEISFRRSSRVRGARSSTPISTIKSKPKTPKLDYLSKKNAWKYPIYYVYIHFYRIRVRQTVLFLKLNLNIEVQDVSLIRKKFLFLISFYKTYG